MMPFCVCVSLLYKLQCTLLHCEQYICDPEPENITFQNVGPIPYSLIPIQSNSQNSPKSGRLNNLSKIDSFRLFFG